MMMILVRYGEIGLKGRPVRQQFENILLRNIRRALSTAGIKHGTAKQRGRIYVDVEDDDRALVVLRDVFGIVSLSPAIETSADLTGITSAAASFAVSFDFNESFAIRATRTGSHDFTSQDIGIAAGQAIVDVTGAPVNLNTPDREIGVEVRDERSFLFDSVIDGPGGLPYGSQGLVVAAVADEDDLKAAWLMMRRGCTTVFVCQLGMADAIPKMLQWRPADITICSDDVLDRAEALAEQRGDLRLVTGQERYQKRGLPVFYPLLGYWEVGI